MLFLEVTRNGAFSLSRSGYVDSSVESSYFNNGMTAGLDKYVISDRLYRLYISPGVQVNCAGHSQFRC